MTWDLAPGDQIRRVELHERFGGRGQGGIGPSRQSPNVFIFSDPGTGEQHGYYDRWEGDVFHYAGEGQVGDQRMVQGNAAILNHVEEERALRVFWGARGTVEYAGEFELDPREPFYLVDAHESGGTATRKVIMFRLIPKGRAVSLKADDRERRTVLPDEPDTDPRDQPQERPSRADAVARSQELGSAGVGSRDTKLVKSAGEFWVCSVLALQGWSVALTRDGIARTDLLGVHSESDASIEVQVKTASHHPRPNWPIGANAQQKSRSSREWFVLVLLPKEPLERPRGYVVPRDHLSAGTWIEHMSWLTDPDAEPGKRNATVDKARVSATTFVGYEERWDLLHNPASEAPVLLPSEFRSLASDQRVGLPPNHPWHVELPPWE